MAISEREKVARALASVGAKSESATPEMRRIVRKLLLTQERASASEAEFRASVQKTAESGIFSRRELAALLGISTTTVQRIVSGKP